MGQIQRYYRMSREKVAIGTTLRGGGALHVGEKIEDILARQCPDGCVPRSDCVFFSDTEDASKHGLTYDKGYLQYVEPIGNVEKRDSYWIGQLQMRHNAQLTSWQDLDIASLSDDELALKYWKGAPSKKPNWEFVASSATVTGYVNEEPVDIRKHPLADALKTVAEYDNSKKAGQ